MISFIITNKDRPVATVVMLVSFGGMQYRKTIGIGCPPAMWSQKKHRAKVTSEYDGSVVNDRIQEWERLGYAAMRHFEELGKVPTKEQFADYLASLRSPIRKECYFCDYIAQVYIPRYDGTRRGHTVTGYRSMLNKLLEYEAHRHRRLAFSDIDMDFYNDFRRWFRDNGYSDNYFGTLIKFVKQCYTEARAVDHLHTLDATSRRDFISISRTADAVYLTDAEVDAVARVDLSPEAIAADRPDLGPDEAARRSDSYLYCRDLFVIGCYTGLRVSDFSRLSAAHFDDRCITIRTHKTGTDVVIPIHPAVRRIIQSGFDFSRKVSDQKLNKHIKDICRLAGITQPVIRHEDAGGLTREVIVEKYQLVSNHTARRSFATNAIRAGVPPLSVMKILGHTKESTTLKYVKLSAVENAELLLDHPFFAE